MSDWLSELAAETGERRPLVRVVVSGVLGSAPREAGTCMLVGEHLLSGSIGGGRLEEMAIEAARTMLAGNGEWQTLCVPLGPAVGQCCGGMVDLWLERAGEPGQKALAALHRGRASEGAWMLATVVDDGVVTHRRLLREASAVAGFGSASLDRWIADERDALLEEEEPARQAVGDNLALLLERLPPPDTPLIVFGAGHVGKAVAWRLAGLPFDVRWVDGREGVFPDLLAPNVRTVTTADPAIEVERALPGAAFLVMTHSHALDYELCRAILLRGDFCFLGLIGSDTKAARFAHRLARDGIAPERIGRLVCPIGIDGIASKRPEAIAVGVCAQLLRLQESGWDVTSAHERGRRFSQDPAGNSTTTSTRIVGGSR